MATGFRTFVRHQPQGGAQDPVTVYDLTKVQDNIVASVDPMVKSLSTSTLDEAQTSLSDYATTANLALKANIASPTFTGDPKAPTPTLGDADTSLATTAFVARLVGKDRGCVPSNGTDATNDLNFSAGALWDDTFAIRIPVAAIAGKQLDADFAAGPNAGMRDSAHAIGNNSYTVYLIAKAEAAAADYMAFRDGDTVTLPTDYIYKRRVFCFRRIGAVNQAVTVTEIFGSALQTLLKTPVFDFGKDWSGVDDAAQTGTSTQIPTGVQVDGLFGVSFFDATASAGSGILITSIDQTDTACVITLGSEVLTFSLPAVSGAGPTRGGGDIQKRMSTSATLRFRGVGTTADHQIGFTCQGWIDPRVS